MKMKRNKGKVHPFTSSAGGDSLSVLNLLPAAILSLVSLLSLEDREVLAYMVTRSLKSTNPSFLPSQDKKTTTTAAAKRCSFDGKSPPLFDCDCFHCYTSFWFRWDSSPNRELIHQAIESFDDRLNDGELLSFRRNKRKDRMGRRKSERLSGGAAGGGGGPEFPAVESQETLGVVLPEESVDVGEEFSGHVGVAAPADELVAAPAVVVRNHKGLARKVLPDVMGIFSSRLWSLWSPK
ncbi:hypothetical protein ABFX02_11G074400 [Erythranthe guttata]